MKLLAIVIGLLIGAVGLVGMVAPSLLLEFGRSLLTPTALYVVAALRIGIGVVLVRIAAVSRLPKVLRVLGVFFILAGLATPFFGVERARAVFDWWSSQGAWFMRVCAGVPVAFALFIVYAVIPPRRAAA